MSNNLRDEKLSHGNGEPAGASEPNPDPNAHPDAVIPGDEPEETTVKGRIGEFAARFRRPAESGARTEIRRPASRRAHSGCYGDRVSIPVLRALHHNHRFFEEKSGKRSQAWGGRRQRAQRPKLQTDRGSAVECHASNRTKKPGSLPRRICWERCVTAGLRFQRKTCPSR